MTETRPWLDASRRIDERVEVLLTEMTVAEKAGLVFHTMVAVGDLDAPNPMAGGPSPAELVVGTHLTHLNLLGAAPSARDIAVWHNALQRLALERTRLGIPVTLSTDPRHSFSDNPGAAIMAGPFSQWPESLGLAAIGDADLVTRFADIARQEYLAVGLRTALHPQVDLATEPRWARQVATFGEDATLSGRLGAAYIRGFQGETFGTHSVSTVTKHFPGGGPQQDGEDPHFAYGREQVYPGGGFDRHLEPFVAAIAAGTRQMMPYYGMPVGTDLEEVGFGFHREVITGILRERLGFDGIVCTDWGLLTDAELFGQPFPARAWGVEHLSPSERMQKALDAGADQFGGEACPELLVELVEAGAVTETRLDASARRLLREKFALGLFDDPFVDEDAADRMVGAAEFRAAGDDAQRASITVLTNEAVLPVARGARLYVEGIDAEVAARYGTVVDRPEDADVAILRVATPYEQRTTIFENFFHAGSLDFPDEVARHIRDVAASVPTIVDVFADRPPILTDVVGVAAAITLNWGASGAALLDVLTGAATPKGRLPFDLPRSMAAVEASRPDIPFDTADPLFRFGHGLEI